MIGHAQITRVTDPELMEAGAVAHIHERTEDGWSWEAVVSRGPNGLVISYLGVWPDDPAASVNSRMLRNVALSTILSMVQGWLEASDIPALQPTVGYESTSLERIKPDGPAKAGRAPLAPELLREVAEGYLEETGPGKPRGAIKRLAVRLDKPEPTVSRWVVRARKEGWLGPAMAGREGAEPGPRLIRAKIEERARQLEGVDEEIEEYRRKRSVE